MSTRVMGSAELNAACRELVSQQLNISLHHDLVLGELATALDAGRLDLPAIQSLVADREISGVLAALAPVSFGKVTQGLDSLDLTGQHGGSAVCPLRPGRGGLGEHGDRYGDPGSHGGGLRGGRR